MIASIGPTNLDLEVDEGPADIEIALLLAEESSTSDGGESQVPDMELQVVAAQLEQLYAAGRIDRHTEGGWIVYRVTPNVCRTLLLLLLKRNESVPHSPL